MPINAPKGGGAQTIAFKHTCERQKPSTAVSTTVAAPMHVDQEIRENERRVSSAYLLR